MLGDEGLQQGLGVGVDGERHVATRAGGAVRLARMRPAGVGAQGGAHALAQSGRQLGDERTLAVEAHGAEICGRVSGRSPSFTCTVRRRPSR